MPDFYVFSTPDSVAFSPIITLRLAAITKSVHLGSALIGGEFRRSVLFPQVSCIAPEVGRPATWRPTSRRPHRPLPHRHGRAPTDQRPPVRGSRHRSVCPPEGG